MNNRTKDAKPDQFVSDPDRFYMKRGAHRGDYYITVFYQILFWGRKQKELIFYCNYLKRFFFFFFFFRNSKAFLDTELHQKQSQ